MDKKRTIPQEKLQKSVYTFIKIFLDNTVESASTAGGPNLFNITEALNC